MARMVDPAYVHKLQKGEHEPSASNNFQREQYRREKVKTVKIQWWLDEINEPILLMVAAPHLPHFHPKHCQSIIDIAHDCSSYAYWDGSQWMHTDVSMEVKVPQKELAIVVSSDDEVEVISSGASMSALNSSKAKSRAKIFPLQYACDMDASFKAMRALSGKVPDRFVAAFGISFLDQQHLLSNNPIMSSSPLSSIPGSQTEDKPGNKPQGDEEEEEEEDAGGNHKSQEKEEDDDKGRKDPPNDVKLYDVKICILDFTGDEVNEVIVKRYNILDGLDELLRYNGRLQADLEEEDEDIDMDDLRPEHFRGAFTVSASTQELVRKVILDRKPKDSGFVVKSVLPGFFSPGQELATYDPEAVPELKWAEGVDEDHKLPGIGPANAWRIVLEVNELVKPVERLSEADRIAALIVEYLRGEYEFNVHVKEMRKVNAKRDTKHAGRTPKCWVDWVEALYFIQSEHKKVPDNHTTDAVGKKITLSHLGAFIGTTGAWVSRCLSAHRQLDVVRRKRRTGYKDFLEDDEKTSAMGIETFLTRLEGLSK
ncbi:hypothetical protein B0H19DRAFT_1261012 [Mycena capillaripes]|nr:hypothetical protein B0H19DRAFT_1261012 [Mycena capillaripes]